jgi:aminoglycoside 3-N-acetyltransferase
MEQDISQADIAGDLQKIGVQEGDILLVHSSLSALGRVTGGANAVIDALLEAIGPEGTLLMPSFLSGSEHEICRRGCVFDLRTSPCEVGLIPETFRKRPGVIRSINPTHCTAGLGKHAAELLAGHQDCMVSVGKNSPYHKFVQTEGKILLLGVTHASNTTLHLVENINGAPTVCRELFKPVAIDTAGQEWVVPTHPHMPGLKRQYSRVESELLETGIQVNGKVGQSISRLINARQMAEVIGERVKKDPVYLCVIFTL